MVLSFLKNFKSRILIFFVFLSVGFFPLFVRGSRKTKADGVKKPKLSRKLKIKKRRKDKGVSSGKEASSSESTGSSSGEKKSVGKSGGLSKKTVGGSSEKKDFSDRKQEDVGKAGATESPSGALTEKGNVETGSVENSEKDVGKKLVKQPDLEKIEPVKRNWKEPSGEREKYMAEAASYYDKISNLNKKSKKILGDKEQAYEKINSALNKAFNQTSSAIGRFVEVGRKIEGYVQQNIARYSGH